MSKIFRRTLIAIILVFGVAANATALLSAWLLHRHLTDEYVTKGRAIAMAIAAASPDALVADDAAAVQSMIDEFLHIEGVGYIFVTDRQGTVVAHTFIPAMPEALLQKTEGSVSQTHLEGIGDYIQVTAPILAGEAGHVSIGMDKAGIWRVMRGAVMRQEALMLIMLAVAVVVFYALVGSITHPLVELAGYAVKIRDHDFSAKPPQPGDDEVGVLARAMQSMAAQLSLLVSDLKRAVADTTRDLEDSLAHTRAIIDNLADGLVVLDADARITLFNPALLVMFGKKADALADKHAAEVFPPAMAALAGACPAENQPTAAEVRLDGGGTGKAVATGVRLAGEERRATIILVRDITVEKAVDRMKTEFISTVSHELRTPLTSVLGFAKIIRRKFAEVVSPALDAATPKARHGARQIQENLDIIVAEGQRLTELVDDVLDIAKMESGRCEWNMVPVSLAEAAAHAVRAVAALAAKKGIALENRLPADLPPVLGDRDRLIQVFVNLLGNAVKFTEKGGVVVEGSVSDAAIHVAVRDTGTGIAPADLERIFEKFRQAGDTLTEKPKGTGLGLPICRQIVERHGGRIWAESEPGHGSVFRFTLPVQPEAAATTPVQPAPACPLARTDKDNPRHILVVDDDASVRRYLETLFTDAGYRVATAANGAEALPLAVRWQPECITMDMRMPGMDGRECIRRLRQNPATSHIPVVVVSVLSDRERNAPGANATLDKPVDQDALLSTVRGLLEGHDAENARPCLILSRDGGREVSRRFFMCPGETTILREETDLWRTVKDGFQGTIFLPASLGHTMDLKRLLDFPGLHVILIPD